MKVLGLLGGMTFESTIIYYNIINRHARSQLGPRSSAPLFIYSANQEEMLHCATSGSWDRFAEIYVKAANTMIQGGAEGIVITAMLAHRAAEQIQQNISVPLLHISDFVAAEIKAKGLTKVGLLGTKVAMESDFVKERIRARTGIEVLTPSLENRDAVNAGIVNELTTGKVSPATHAMFVHEAKLLVEQGAQGLILGSTDLGFVIRQEDVGVHLFDTARIHALGVADWALGAE